MFHPDACLRSYQAGSDEPFAESVGHEEIASVPATMGQMFRRTVHQMTNHLVEVDGDTATGSLLCNARFLPLDSAAGEAGLNVVRYVDRYERRAGVWRIALRELHFLWSERHPLLDGGFPPAREP